MHKLNDSIGPLNEELQCSICLDVFTDPVTTPCGHNFCRTCLNKCWTNTQTCFSVKSCLTCQSSYCETHLEPHHRVSRLKKHTLINAVENLEDYICQKHERPLELFCRDDQTCVCLSCTEGDHRTHNTVPIEEESQQKKLHDHMCRWEKPTEGQTSLQHSTDLAHPKLILSDDGKQVSHGDIVHDVPENPKRFDKTISVLAKQGFSSGRFYYEVQVKGKTGWNLGVARESINRKEKITLNPENGFWAVFLRNENQYKACESSPVSFSLRVKPEIVGVFVDYEEGLVSFYYVGSSSHIYSFTVKYCPKLSNCCQY
uniref:E3 ubiquitin-protein ligase TRIM39-like n=1 Tax=Sinocyclocheilus rhinocerous TaxID=307959 RepID=A0A673ILT2_9TELE